MMFLSTLLLFFLSVPVVAVSSSVTPTTNAKQNMLQLMFYNVENLFDTVHEKGKRDWDFVPLSHPGKKAGCAQVESEHYRQRCLETDWNKQKLELKLAQVSKVVLQEGRPDILGLCEVENAKVLKQLAGKLGYSHYLITNGNDPRGIDVALLYNDNAKHLTYQKHNTYRLQTGRHLRKATRDLLEVEFSLAGKNERLVVYVVHWPSQRSPSEARMVAARRTVELIRNQQRRDQRVNIIVMGDFNVIYADHPHPFRELFDSRLLDAHRVRMSDRSIPWEQRRAVPIGTYFYPPKMSWDRLDRIFYNKNLANNKALELDVHSFRTLAYPWLTKIFTYSRPGEFLLGSTINNVPKRYDFTANDANTAGYSDHFALRVDLRYR